VVVGQIEGSSIRYGKRRSLLVRIADQTGYLVLRFFHFNQSRQRAFKQGAWIHCYGETRRGSQSLELVHPEYNVFSHPPKAVTAQCLTPVYPTTEGVGPILIRKLVNQSIDKNLPGLKEIFPTAIQREFGLMPIGEAVKTTHHPPPDADTDALVEGIHPAQQRLALEELLAHHLALSELRRRRYANVSPAFTGGDVSWPKLRHHLKFDLTPAQRRVIEEVGDDISRSRPCLRLIQGDVGSGKTVVAAAAALRAIDNGYQVALMAPTELLAEQHRQTFAQWFLEIAVTVEGLTGKLSAADKRAARHRIASGAAQMMIGTHALFQEDVKFSNLGLIIVDEQHRFGVDQRLALRNKSGKTELTPHQLIMSATPIPRSLAMIFYADLDVSSIDELPPGRKPVQTVVVPDSRRAEIARRIEAVCRCGQQAYWVCPLIEESDKLQAQAATETHLSLQKLLPELRVVLIHGRLKSREKESIMEDFGAGNIDLLVATTVIEVGVDVPNANLMVIENAERLGLAQLHQLRGRVGRGTDRASCVLIYQSPLSRTARERLSIIRQTNDGFKIAQKDLEHRGPGELLGTRQTGLQQMQVANLARDKYLLPKIERLAHRIRTQHPETIQTIIDRWIKNKNQYANV